MRRPGEGARDPSGARITVAVPRILVMPRVSRARIRCMARFVARERFEDHGREKAVSILRNLFWVHASGTFQQRGMGAVAAVRMPGSAEQTSRMELTMRAAVAS